MMKMNSMKKNLCCVGTVMAVGSVMAFAGSCKMTNMKCIKRMIRQKANMIEDIVDAVTSMM